MKKTYLIAVFLLPYFLIAQKNLVSNGGFEFELNDWRGDASTSLYDKKFGNASCIINQYIGAEWKGIDQTINIPKNTVALEFSAWIKSDAIEKGKNPWNTGKFDIEFLTSSSQNISNESIAAILGTTPWKKYSKIVQVPSGSSKFRIMLALGQTNGTIFFDDVKVTALKKEDYEKVIDEETKKRESIAIQNTQNANTENFFNGNFENGKTSWRGNYNLTNQIVKEGTSALILSSETKDWTGIDQQVTVPENMKSVTISGCLKAENIKQGDNIWNNGLLNVEFTSDGKTKTSQDESITFISGNTDWQYYSKTYHLPNNTQKIRLMIALGFATGKLYADDIKVTFNP